MLDRRRFVAFAVGLGFAVPSEARPKSNGAAAKVAPANAGAAATTATTATPPARPVIVQTAAAKAEAAVAPAPASQRFSLQAAIDDAARRKVPLVLGPGVYECGPVTVHAGLVLAGAGPATVLKCTGTGPFISLRKCDGVVLRDFTIDGGQRPAGTGNLSGLIVISDCDSVTLERLVIRNSSRNGVAATQSSGRITACTIEDVADAGYFQFDSTFEISANTIRRCGNNGIQVWRSAAAEDGSRILANTISVIRADKGGTGENGNGINVFRAGNVQVSNNRIADCAYSAVRGNAASDLQITGNMCMRIGEVALYAEFGFTGAMITSNIVDGAATGISVTNFDQGGRLGVVQGNLIRNLQRRELEPIDKRGEGIVVEADTVVSGNTIEGAPTCGLLIGNGPYLRDVNATGNLIRQCQAGILVSPHGAAGMVLLANNLISGAVDGAIRAHDAGRPRGPELAKSAGTGRIVITGNSVT